ncbi:aminodeoxychorismate/anthranilate synthase component II [Alphaproteobacteria bacterium]|nr:aminodeoxychorismate/anthranilate synthase component II [Alphaproteobacteria bacterium]
MFLLIDNYDSFTYNLCHYLGELGAEVRVFRNDAISADEALDMAPEGMVVSPGPCDPAHAGICLELIEKAADRRVPLIGVCLGHQSIGQAFGGRVVRAPFPVHGKTDCIEHNGKGLFRDIPSPFTATRYHSLIVEKDSLPPSLEVTAWSRDGLIMALAHREAPIFGVQFHPESFASQYGHEILGNFLSLAARHPSGSEK